MDLSSMSLINLSEAASRHIRYDLFFCNVDPAGWRELDFMNVTLQRGQRIKDREAESVLRGNERTDFKHTDTRGNMHTCRCSLVYRASVFFHDCLFLDVAANINVTSVNCNM